MNICKKCGVMLNDGHVCPKCGKLRIDIFEELIDLAKITAVVFIVGYIITRCFAFFS